MRMRTRDFSKLLLSRPALAEAMRKDFGLFCRQAWPHLHRGSPLSWTPWHDLICEYLVLVHQKKLLRLIVNCPPRFAKSSIVTILWPIWCWLQNSTLDFLCCSYEIDLATNHNQDRRRLLDSKWFTDHFGDSVKLSTDRSQAGEFSNIHGGTMMAASSNSKAQGRGGDVVVCDDLLSADMAYSEVFRNETNSWLTHQLPQRLNNPSESAIVVVAQRLHQNDPCGYLLAQEDSDWTLLKLALVAEKDEVWTFPISGRTMRRKKDECLDSRRWSKKVIKQRQQNRLVWAGQFQQEPMDPAGNMIKTDDICYFGGRDPKTNVLDPVAPAEFDRKIISVDCAFKDRPSNDYVVVLVVGVVGSRRYILHVTNAHLDLDGTMNEIRNARNMFGPISAVLIEDKANGSSVIAKLTDEIPGVVPVQPQGGKMSRLVATSPEFQARNWFVERHGAWTHKLVEQLTMFPNAKNDDISDAISQCAVWLQANTYEDTNAVAEWGKRSAAGEYDERREERRLERKNRELAAKPATASASGYHPGKCPPCKLGTNPDGSKMTGHATRYSPTWQILCDCGAVDGILPAKPAGQCCSNYLPQIISGGIRCGNCGWQSNQNAPIPRGPTFRELAARRGRFGRFG
jgi:predicted phage terminase large subunit-like protein